MADEKPDRSQNAAVIWARYSQIAFVIPAAVVIGLFLGKLLDYWLHTHWLFLVGIIVGAVAGFVDVIRTVIRQTK
ncbi:MAG TPA: AtpZ/AtpI family protein [Terriglobales bacterium]|jgi:F0F1-type ATP synthase assembly protein I